jgi:hypothetical protein
VDARGAAIVALAEQARSLVLAGEFDAARVVVDAAARIATAPAAPLPPASVVPLGPEHPTVEP